MKRGSLAVILFLIILPAWWLARAATGGAAAHSPPAATAATTTLGEPAATFVPVDVYMNTGTQHLGAYQLEVVTKNAKIVGLEGGQPGPFDQAPFYDPVALAGLARPAEAATGDKLIIAAFSTEEVLPAGLTRVARLHFLMNGAAEAGKMPDMTSRVVVATDAEGAPIKAEALLRLTQGESR